MIPVIYFLEVKCVDGEISAEKAAKIPAVLPVGSLINLNGFEKEFDSLAIQNWSFCDVKGLSCLLEPETTKLSVEEMRVILNRFDWQICGE